MSDIPEFSGGSDSAREKLNTISREVSIFSKIKGSKFINVQKTPAGLSITINIEAFLAFANQLDASLRPLYITALNDDTLTGRYLYPDGLGSLEQGTVDITVLKPWTLRRTAFDGQTVNGVAYTYYDAATREGDDGETQQTEYVTQDYFVGALIYVQAVNEPNADVIDANVDARAWCKGDPFVA